VDEFSEFVLRRPGDPPPPDPLIIILPEVIDQGVEAASQQVVQAKEKVQALREEVEQTEQVHGEKAQLQATSAEALFKAEEVKRIAVAEATEVVSTAKKGKAKKEAEEQLEAVEAEHSTLVVEARAANELRTSDVAEAEKLKGQAKQALQLLEREVSALTEAHGQLLQHAIRQRYNEGKDLYFALDGNDRQAQQLLMEAEALKGGPYEQSARLVEKLHRERAGERTPPPTPSDSTAWLQNKLKNVYTKEPNRQYKAQSSLVALQAEVDQLEATKLSMEGELAKMQADAQAEVDAIKKKAAKEAAQKEWDDKIKGAQEALRRHTDGMVATLSRRDSEAEKASSAQCHVQDAADAQANAKHLEGRAQESAQERFMDIQLQRQQELSAHAAANKPQGVRLRSMPKTLRPRSAHHRPMSAFQRQAVEPPPTVDFRAVIQQNDEINISMAQMHRSLVTPSSTRLVTGDSRQRPSSAGVNRHAFSPSSRHAKSGRPSSAFYPRSAPQSSSAQRRPWSAVTR